MRGACFGKLSLNPKNFSPHTKLARPPQCRGTKGEKQEPPRRKTWQEKKCGPGQPPRPHGSWSSRLTLPPLDDGRNFGPYGLHLEHRMYPERPRNRDPAITKLLSSAVNQRLSPAQRAGWGRRPQRPDNQHALSRIPGVFPSNSPSRIAGYRWRTAIIRQAQEPHVFDEPLSDRSAQTATGNNHRFVQKLWTLRLLCGKARKTATKSGRKNSAQPDSVP